MKGRGGESSHQIMKAEKSYTPQLPWLGSRRGETTCSSQERQTFSGPELWKSLRQLYKGPQRSSENVLIAVLPNKRREFQVWQFLYGLYVKYVCLDNPRGPERGQPGVQFSGDETGRLSRERAFTFPSDLTVLDRSNGTGS